MNKVKKIIEEYYRPYYYCVVRMENDKQYFKIDTVSMKDNESVIEEITQTGQKWFSFMDVINNLNKRLERGNSKDEE